MIDLTGIGALISTLTGLLVAGGSILLQRQRRSAIDTDEMEDELEVRTQQYQFAIRLIRAWEDYGADNGLEPLARPAELRAGYFQAQQQRKRRRASSDDDAGSDAGPTRHAARA